MQYWADGSEGRTQDYVSVTNQPWYSGASYSLPILMLPSGRGREDDVRINKGNAVQ